MTSCPGELAEFNPVMFRTGEFEVEYRYALTDDLGVARPVDLTGGGIYMDIRLQADGDVDAPLLRLTQVANDFGSVITLVAPTDGLFRIFIANDDIRALPWPTSAPAQTQLFATDLLLVRADGVYAPFAGGVAEVRPGVTGLTQ